MSFLYSADVLLQLRYQEFEEIFNLHPKLKVDTLWLKFTSIVTFPP